MDRLARFYEDLHEEALQLARQGNKRDALDMLCELRLRPDLALFRRARVSLLQYHRFQAVSLMALQVNLSLANLHDDVAERLGYAEECIELINSL
jgi:hypothetical protein